MSAPMLELNEATVRFGGLTAVSKFSTHVGENELVGLIGPNGAGKTTAFNLITGVYPPTEGEVRFQGRVIRGMKPFQITKLGIARTFQNIRLFGSMTVFDNIRAATQLHRRHGVIDALFRGNHFRKSEGQVEAQVMELLEIFSLGAMRDEPSSGLCYGDRRRLEIVRALATRPKLLLLDEPAAGMNPTEKADLMKLIQFVKERYKISVLLVEHDMKVVMGICQRIAVLEYGRKIAEGTPEEIQHNPKVIEAYLGAPPEPKGGANA